MLYDICMRSIARIEDVLETSWGCDSGCHALLGITAGMPDFETLDFEN
jgi:hypothetical protein